MTGSIKLLPVFLFHFNSDTLNKNNSARTNNNKTVIHNKEPEVSI